MEKFVEGTVIGLRLENQKRGLLADIVDTSGDSSPRQVIQQRIASLREDTSDRREDTFKQKTTVGNEKSTQRTEGSFKEKNPVRSTDVFKEKVTSLKEKTQDAKQDTFRSRVPSIREKTLERSEDSSKSKVTLIKETTERVDDVVKGKVTSIREKFTDRAEDLTKGKTASMKEKSTDKVEDPFKGRMTANKKTGLERNERPLNPKSDFNKVNNGERPEDTLRQRLAISNATATPQKQASLIEKIGSIWGKGPDRREYTVMVVPHHGNNVFRLRLPVKLLKLTALVVCVLMILTVGTLVNYKHIITMASAEKLELENLRKVNASQNNQIEQLAKATAGLQEDMTRLNKLDAEIRRMVNSEDMPTAASRSGVQRPPVPEVPGNYTGQGGPNGTPALSDLTNLVQDLQQAATAREESLTSMKGALSEKIARMAATPSIWPAAGEVTSRFGYRNSPFGGGGGDYHPGLDIANDYGTPIVATADGTVVHSGWYGGYGNLVQVDHGHGIVSFYGHCSSIVVNVGDKVKKGGLIAYMGSTGYSTGNHVHYEIRVNGTAVNPTNYL